jgi:hypothetical protein
MQETLALTCVKTNQRPRHPTDEMRRRAALKIAKDLGDDFGSADEVADNIVAATRYLYDADGYQIARELERSQHWDCDMDTAEKLDKFSMLCNDELRTAQRQWAADNPMEPPFPMGATVKTPSQGVGTIIGICEYSVFSYRVRTPELKENAAWIIAFEDVSAT